MKENGVGDGFGRSFQAASHSGKPSGDNGRLGFGRSFQAANHSGKPSGDDDASVGESTEALNCSMQSE